MACGAAGFWVLGRAGNAHRRTAAMMSACRRFYLSNPAKVCALAGGKLFRRRWNCAHSRATAGTNWLSSRQAAWVQMLQVSTEALLATKSKSASAPRMLHPQALHPPRSLIAAIGALSGAREPRAGAHVCGWTTCKGTYWLQMYTVR